MIYILNLWVLTYDFQSRHYLWSSVWMSQSTRDENISTGHEPKSSGPGGDGVIIGHVDKYLHIYIVCYFLLYFTWRFDAAPIFGLQEKYGDAAV